MLDLAYRIHNLETWLMKTILLKLKLGVNLMLSYSIKVKYLKKNSWIKHIFNE